MNTTTTTTHPTAPASMATHTPTPYRYAIDDEFYGLCILFEDGCVAQLCRTEDVDPESIATAKFIVRACNSHAQLVAALDLCERTLNANFANPQTIEGKRATVAMNHARAALTAAQS